MSRSNGDGLPLKAALKATKARRERALRAAEAANPGAATSEAPQIEGFEQEHPHDEREEEEHDGDPTRGDGGVAGGSA